MILTYDAEFKSAVKDIRHIDDALNIRIDYLGRKGKISNLFKSLSNLSQEERRDTGKLLNDFNLETIMLTQLFPEICHALEDTTR